MLKHQPFLTAIDVQNWISKSLWHIIKEMRFTTGKGETRDKPRQEWTFQQDDKGNCVFLGDGRCLIYRERPLVCRAYPTGGVCESVQHMNPSVHLSRAFQKAIKDWNRSDDQWRQDKLEEMIKECEKRGLKSKYRQTTSPVFET